MSKIRLIQPNYLPDTRQRYAQAMSISEVEEWILLSGQVAVDLEYKPVHVDDYYGQAKYIFNNIKKLLNDEGLGLDAIVKINIYTRDISEYGQVAKAKKEVLGDIVPTSTVMEVNRLILDEILMEVEVTAVK